MKNAIIAALIFLVAILAFGTRNEAQAVIEDTTVRQTVGLQSASEDQRVISAVPDSFRPRLLAGRKDEQRVAGPPVPLAAGIGVRNSNAATDAIANINPLDAQAERTV